MYHGITEHGVRQAFLGDIAKYTHKINRLSASLNLPHDDIDVDTQRKEDLEDAKSSFECAVFRVLDEISMNAVQNIDIFNSNIQQLLQDIYKYEEIIEKTLALFKHIPLSMMEARALRLDMKRLVSWVNSRHAEVVANIPPSTNIISNIIPDTVFNKPNLSLRIPESVQTFAVQSMELNAAVLSRVLYSNEFDNDELMLRQHSISAMQLSPADITPINVQVGKGGFSDVFLGTFQYYHRIAIKSYRPNVNFSFDQQRRAIENEIILLKYLGSHPTLCQFFGFVFNESINQLDLIFELAPYGSLASVLYDQVNFVDRFPLELNIAWMCDIADALCFLHSKQIKHRDLKAENCLVFEKFRVKLSDFGPAKQHLASGQPSESRVGTFAFMAPEIRMGGASEYASDIFSFAMTAIQIFTREQPRIDDFKGQLTAALANIVIPSQQVRKSLFDLLLDCIKFEINCPPTNLRPTAQTVVSRLRESLNTLGGDPREKPVGSVEYLPPLEIIAKKLEAQRLQPVSLHNSVNHDTMSGNYGYPPQPSSPASVKGFGVPLMGSSSSGYNSPHHSSNPLPGPLTIPADGMSIATPGRYGSSGASVFSIGGIYHDQFQFDADDRMVLARFLVENTSLQDHTIATRYADILVKNGVSNPEVLRRRVNRNQNYLFDIGLDEIICQEIYAVLATKPDKVENPRYSIVKQHQSNPLYVVHNRMSVGLHTFSMHGEDISGQSVDQYNNPPPNGINISIRPYPNTTMDQSILSGSSYTFEDMEDRLSLIKFLQDEIHCDAALCNQYADMIFEYGICNVEVLKRRVLRNPSSLNAIGLDQRTTNEIIDYFGIDGSGGIMQGNVLTGGGLGLSMYQMSRSPRAGGSKHSSPVGNGVSRKFNRRVGSVFGGNADIMPTEVSRLYYDATQCHKQEAYAKLIEVADKGDQLALGFLMRIFATGQGNFTKDVAQAQQLGQQLLPWLKDAIESGGELLTMYAKYLIGVCYSEGLGTNLDHREAMRWYRQSAEQGYAGAQAMVGYCYFFGKGVNRNFDEAVKYYRQAAEQGYAGAQCNLGLCYEHGYGVVKNAEQAFHWYLLAADQGEAAALYNVGYCYEKGIGTMVNPSEAFRRFQRSAELGYTAAEYNLGLCYYTGAGTEQDFSQAVQWLHRAASVKQYAPAQCKLGLCYENGHGVEQNYGESTHWYQAAAGQGYAPALYYLGFSYFAGLGVARDVEQAVKLYQQAAEKGYPAAQNNLGFCYFHGTGIMKNHKLAVQWYRKAAEQGYAAAQYNLGYCYEKGFGVSTKLHEVMKWYRLAADNGNEKAKKALTKLNA